MTAKYKPVPKDWQLMIDEETLSRSLSRMAFEILERDRDLKSLALVGIRTGGEFLARRLQKLIEEIEGVQVAYGIIDITLYRDDLSAAQVPANVERNRPPF